MVRFLGDLAGFEPRCPTGASFGICIPHWCGAGDLNPHAHRTAAPETAASAIPPAPLSFQGAAFYAKKHFLMEFAGCAFDF